ncbi:hypothetical protein CPB83DRAFT_846676 [Crepidotus variabilis]|uniref:SET domain-containing protein n=1 Tax=Crepidotus variabilis TaxID=179855 RepID=A0A9P6EQC5_9AGAR|nr:hypothetical protein CPB83DRAFT_846676 [Crepidotus variabilis]
MNSLTLAPYYPATKPTLSCTQIVSLHLLLHRPPEGRSTCDDPIFGPFISVLPAEFDWHPLTWLWRESKASGEPIIESRLLDSLPPSILSELNRMFGLFQADWSRIFSYLQEHPSVLKALSPYDDREVDFLWGWLNVNTRCIYHRLAKTRSHPDNMTLCPILDFANHTPKEPYTYPRASQAELWNTGPSRKFGENFILQSPASCIVPPGTELFLRYGMHANSTLFTEYGFVNMVKWSDPAQDISAETESQVDSSVEKLFEERGPIGSWMKNVLLDEGYWGDWTMHTIPAPAHPSYRLITALRLYHILPTNTEALPSQHRADQLLNGWRNTTLGNQDVISTLNENLWRDTLLRLCEGNIRNAEGRSCLKAVFEETDEGNFGWHSAAVKTIQLLWQEELHVAKAVMKSLQENVAF